MKTTVGWSLLLMVASWLLASPAPGSGVDFDPGRVGYTATFNGRSVQWREFAFFVLPQEAATLEVPLAFDQPVRVEVSDGELLNKAAGRWLWTAPDTAGLVTLEVRPAQSAPMTLRLFVLTPGEPTNGYLNGYRMGRYPAEPLKGNPIYLPPEGYIEVYPSMLDIKVSPHFTLGQFLCKQQPEHWPKYLVLRESLLAKLEVLLAEVNRRGVRTDSFTVMSGYRTPWYNKAIENGRYSRHIWGGAADIFIDTSGDGQMDDLNKDGRVDIQDAEWLRRVVDDVHRLPNFQRLIGGVGLYGPRPHRGPFVHVDARGFNARWELP
ncbi:D-Ala-D-Ala carboxypeptidase family metallohydrolase [Marinimicrobium sp. C6131]|uniref:D-Ala-D-Ala carboxypeptidase family metallohydrolase n=1 Tax=Marinimicrobium sp. C6131 TaxID=3022676 RepID=UPI00223E8CE3|nr:D-Ala-D-Ala carboxypeptidase family metallohydrolase [Marinimicrobium sp. C6131]UZJ45804.1 D-Ala-D-Ala carboxypeptidase family metallohydrolase [Marinimicrobium sp. C6131]